MNTRRTYEAAKRAVDIGASATGLLVLAPAFVACALAVKASSAGPVFFAHERIGRNGQRFRLLKFRSMFHRTRGASITSATDSRITPVGRFLRRSKLDELPQLLNVLSGEMSLVGPRPEVSRYVEKFPQDYARILSVRPGITDFAAIEFRNEEDLLVKSENPEVTYVSEILPKKIALYHRYLDERSLRTDISILFSTLKAIVG